MSNIQHSSESSSVAADSVSRPTPRLWFITEIQHMMYGFGDCRRPLAETAALVEEIVYREMVEILYQAEEIARQRYARAIGIEDFLFLLRRDRKKLKRLLTYLQFRDIKTAAVKGLAADDDDPVDPDIRHPVKKRSKICYDFLSIIDQTGELLSLLEDTTEDEIKQQRKLRAEVMSRYMDTQQYLEYCEARQASFTPRYKTQKFKEWLLSCITLEIKPSPFAIEVLSYLAHETVAQIVDFALLVKQDMGFSTGDPFSLQMTPQCTSLDSITPSAGATSSAMGQSTPSPPDTPGSMADTPNLLSLNSTFSSSSATRQKAKKRKLSGFHLSRELINGSAITPSEVREALRRFMQPSGPYDSFSKQPLVGIAERHLAC